MNEVLGLILCKEQNLKVGNAEESDLVLPRGSLYVCRANSFIARKTW